MSEFSIEFSSLIDNCAKNQDLESCVFTLILDISSEHLDCFQNDQSKRIKLTYKKRNCRSYLTFEKPDTDQKFKRKHWIPAARKKYQTNKKCKAIITVKKIFAFGTYTIKSWCASYTTHFFRSGYEN